eukprot:5678811-Prymnesium_polylepis.1
MADELQEAVERAERATRAEVEQRALSLSLGELEVRLRQSLTSQGKQLHEAMETETAAQRALAACQAERDE